MATLNNNINAIDKYFKNIDNYDNIEDDDTLKDFLNEYKINNYSKEQNSKIFLVLSFKLKKQLETEYYEFLNSFDNNDNNFDNVHNTDKNFIFEMANKYTQSRYKHLIKYDKNYKLIPKIQKKYHVKPQDNIIINVN